MSDDVDLTNTVGYWVAAALALSGGSIMVFYSTLQPDALFRVILPFGTALYFIGITLIIHGGFSQKKAFNYLRQEICRLSQNTNLKSPENKVSIINPSNIEDIRIEINLHAIEFKTRLNRIEEKIENSATVEKEPSKMTEGVALIVGVLLGIWSGILGSISITAMFEMMKIGKSSIDPIVLILSFVLPILFLIWFTWKCWTTILKPAYSTRGISDRMKLTP